MNTFRAKRIADYFSSVGFFKVENKLHGIEVSHLNSHVYFEDETAFWSFLFYLAHAAHYESLIADAQAKLVA